MLLHTDTFTHKRFCTQKLLRFFTQFEPHFVGKGCRRTIEPHFVRRGCRGSAQIAILSQFLTIEPHFVRNIGHFVAPRRHRPRP